MCPLQHSRVNYTLQVTGTILGVLVTICKFFRRTDALLYDHTEHAADPVESQARPFPRRCCDRSQRCEYYFVLSNTTCACFSSPCSASQHTLELTAMSP